jgi:thioredoxin-like negative regulator of GroEL
MSTDPKEQYHQAIDALNRGDWKTTQALSMALVRELPPHAGVYFVAGVAARELLQIPLAIECLEQAVKLSPTRPDYVAQLARAWSQASEPGRAVELADRAAAMPGADAVALDALGLVYTQAHAYSKAATMFGKVALLLPESARHQFNHATALVHAGDVDGAARALDACIRADPRYWKAYLLRAQLRRYSRSDNHIDQLEELRALAGGDILGQLCLNLALSKELEDTGAYSQAFERLVEGKSWGSKSRNYETSRDEELFSALMDVFRDGVPVSAGYDSPEPIFIIGLPRTGTTLVERIISSHSQVHSAGELQNFSVSLKRASGSRTRSMFDLDTILRSRGIEWKALGERYVSSTRPGTSLSPRFIDKLPHNFLYAGHIAAALPNAKIVCLRRHPMDSCLSNFRQLFALTSPYYDYSFDLMDTARYYVLFDRLMSFWRECMPERILEIEYESVIDDLEAGARTLLDFCDLPWEDACLRFEENEAPVATASAVQVRSPIYRSAIGRWRRYESQLQPVKELLKTSGIEVPE